MTRMTTNEFSKFISDYADLPTGESGSVRHALGLPPDQMNGAAPESRWTPVPAIVRAL